MTEEVANVEMIRVELKYCEACGGLWLRAPGSAAPYCRNCEKSMAEIARAIVPQAEERRRP